MDTLIASMRALVISRKDPTTIKDLLADYKSFEGRMLNVRSYGFHTVEELLISSGKFELQKKADKVYILPKYQKSTAHIEMMVQKQKSSSKNHQTSRAKVKEKNTIFVEDRHTARGTSNFHQTRNREHDIRPVSDHGQGHLRVKARNPQEDRYTRRRTPSPSRGRPLRSNGRPLRSKDNFGENSYYSSRRSSPRPTHRYKYPKRQRAPYYLPKDRHMRKRSPSPTRGQSSSSKDDLNRSSYSSRSRHDSDRYGDLRRREQPSSSENSSFDIDGAYDVTCESRSDPSRSYKMFASSNRTEKTFLESFPEPIWNYKDAEMAITLEVFCSMRGLPAPCYDIHFVTGSRGYYCTLQLGDVRYGTDHFPTALEAKLDCARQAIRDIFG